MKKNKAMAFILVFLLGMSHQQASTKIKLGGSLKFNHWADKELVRQIYGWGGLMYTVHAALEIWSDRFEVRAERTWINETGETTITKEETLLSIKAWTLGSRIRVLNIKRWSVYLGAGFVTYIYTETPPERFEPYSDRTQSGFHFELGTYLALKDWLLLDINIRNVVANTEPFDELIKFGGIQAGLGLEILF